MLALYGFFPQAPTGGWIACASMSGSVCSVSLRWLIYAAAMEGEAPYGLSLTFKPPRRDDPPTLLDIVRISRNRKMAVLQRAKVLQRRGLNGWQSNSLVSSAPCFAAQRVCCLLVLDSVTSTPQWIRQPKPRGVVYDVCECLCVNVCSEVLGLLSP